MGQVGCHVFTDLNGMDWLATRVLGWVDKAIYHFQGLKSSWVDVC